mgnify:FL=1
MLLADRGTEVRRSLLPANCFRDVTSEESKMNVFDVSGKISEVDEHSILAAVLASL